MEDRKKKERKTEIGCVRASERNWEQHLGYERKPLQTKFNKLVPLHLVRYFFLAFGISFLFAQIQELKRIKRKICDIYSSRTGNAILR